MIRFQPMVSAYFCLLALYVAYVTRQTLLEKVIRERRLRRLDHVTRMDEVRIPKQALQWEVAGFKRRPGRPRIDIANKGPSKNGINLGRGWSISSKQTDLVSTCGPMHRRCWMNQVVKSSLCDKFIPISSHSMTDVSPDIVTRSIITPPVCLARLLTTGNSLYYCCCRRWWWWWWWWWKWWWRRRCW